MDEPHLLPEDDPLHRWTVPLNEPEPALPGAIQNDVAEIPDVLRFLEDYEPYPSEGYHPRLRRFGDAA
jgi:hypothetical protein